MSHPPPPALALIGPTASGKTDLALALAERFPVEIISLDSAQVFLDMDIGTAKPDRDTLARFPHHLIDLITPEERYSAAQFRADALRTGAISTTVPDDAAVMWSVQAGRKVSPPVAADGKVFAALVDEHQVVCLDARDGRRRWQFTAGARIDSPPTWHAGTVLFGSADGCVYCLRADDGALAWRFRAAPQDRWIGAMEQLESAWPVHGSVLVQDGKITAELKPSWDTPWHHVGDSSADCAICGSQRMEKRMMISVCSDCIANVTLMQ